MLRVSAGLLALAVLAVGCREEAPAPASTVATAPATPSTPTPVELTIEPESIAPPPGSQTPNLFTTAGGDLLLSWLEPAANEQLTLRFARLGAQGWSTPQTIVQGRLLDNWADFPAIGALFDDTLVATWLEPHADGRQGYGIRWSRSIDGGASWSPPQVLSDHTGAPEYGFVSMATTPEGLLAVYWLDGRAVTEQGGQMQLHTAIIGREGPPLERGLVDDRVCDCCQTSAASTPRGPVVAYRDRSVEEIRDIHVAGPHPRLGEPVHDDGWQIMGCPVNGPSLGSHGERLAVAWFSAPDDAAQVKAAFGPVGGEFGAPVRLDLGRPVGRVSLVMPTADAAIVTFVERDGDAGGAKILARRVTAQGELGPAHAIARTTDARASGFPRAARHGERIVWAWTELSDAGPQVHVASAPLASLG